jgi:N-acetylneuraminic acid mutarotase
MTVKNGMVLVFIAVLISFRAAAWAAWETRDGLPDARSWGALVSDGTYLYYIGGALDDGYLSNTVFRYDPSSDYWNSRPTLPTDFAYGNGVYYNGKIYIPGGYGMNTLLIYNIAGDSWGTGASVPSGYETECYAVTFVKDHGLYRAGGYLNDDYSYHSFMISYDPDTDSWDTSPADMEFARYSPAMWGYGDYIYVGGGNSSSYIRMFQTSRYDIAADTWSAADMADLTSPRDMTAYATAYDPSNNGLFFIIGGRDSGFNPMTTVESYNTSTDAWTTLDPLPVAAMGAQAACLDGYIYSVGGDTQFVGATTSNFRLAFSGSCELTGTIPTTSTTSTTIPSDDDAGDDASDDAYDDEADDVSDDDVDHHESDDTSGAAGDDDDDSGGCCG